MVYQHVAPSLASNGYRVLLYDLYGRGYSDAPRTTYDTTLYTTQLALLMQHVGWNRAGVVGVSMVSLFYYFLLHCFSLSMGQNSEGCVLSYKLELIALVHYCYFSLFLPALTDTRHLPGPRLPLHCLHFCLRSQVFLPQPPTPLLVLSRSDTTPLHAYHLLTSMESDHRAEPHAPSHLVRSAI